MGIVKVPCCKCGAPVTVDLSDCEPDDGFAQWALNPPPGKGPRCPKC